VAAAGITSGGAQNGLIGIRLAGRMNPNLRAHTRRSPRGRQGNAATLRDQRWSAIAAKKPLFRKPGED